MNKARPTGLTVIPMCWLSVSERAPDINEGFVLVEMNDGTTVGSGPRLARALS